MGAMGVRVRSEREGIFVYIELTHFVVHKKLTRCCKMTIPQFKNTKRTQAAFVLITHI